jgi:hypothetical protein
VPEGLPIRAASDAAALPKATLWLELKQRLLVAHLEGSAAKPASLPGEAELLSCRPAAAELLIAYDLKQGFKFSEIRPAELLAIPAHAFVVHASVSTRVWHQSIQQTKGGVPRPPGDAKCFGRFLRFCFFYGC